MDSWVQSACVLCSNGCGLDIGVKDGRIVGVRGRADDHVNRGRLGPKGLHGWEANNSADRLTSPLIRKEGKLEPATWDEAMNLIAERSKQIIDKHSASAIGFYTSGQLFLEEYYTLAVIGKAGLGTPHMDGNTRLCTATAGQALKETFGTDGQPASYTDIDTTEAILHVGHNVAEAQTVLWSRILDRRRGPKPPKLVVIDPRATATAEEADVHLTPILGTNVAVMNGLLNLIIESGRIDQEFIEAHTVGFEPGLQPIHRRAELARILSATQNAMTSVKEAPVGEVEHDDSKRHGLAEYLGLLKDDEHEIAAAFNLVAKHHGDEPDIVQTCQRFAATSEVHEEAIASLISRYGGTNASEASRVRKALFQGPRSDGLGLVQIFTIFFY